MTVHPASWMLRTIFVVLALMSCSVAVAQDDGAGDSPGVADTDAARDSSKQDQMADSWFNLQALDLNVYGLSYHPDREAVRRLHVDNQVNLGLGLHYELASDARGATLAEVGMYHDSGRNWAKFAALGYQFKFGERWRIGGALAVFNSRTYNRGATFIGMTPLITYDMGRIKLNAVYLPKFRNYNEVDAFGLYISIPLGQWSR